MDKDITNMGNPGNINPETPDTSSQTDGGEDMMNTPLSSPEPTPSTTQQPVATTPQENEGTESSMGPVVGAIIIIVILIVGGLYVWGKQLSNNDGEVVEETSMETEMEETAPEDDTLTTEIQEQSSSDELSDIEADLEANEDFFDDIDSDLDSI